MSKPVKEMMIADYQQRFVGIDSALLIDIRALNANENNSLRIDLQSKAIRITVLKNSLARKAFADTSLASLNDAMEGPSALVYGADSVIEVARELVEWAKKVDRIQLKAAILDGELYAGGAGVKKLSTFPTRDEALGQIVQLVLTPGGEIVGVVEAAGCDVVSIVESIVDKLEAGETIEKVA